jgi:F5/8 type C domain/Putative Ig domain
MHTSVLAILLASVAACCPLRATAADSEWSIDANAFVCTWLVNGPFANDAANSGFTKDWIGESSVLPTAADPAWRFFDDRLFTRSYDSYNDLYSYLRIKRKLSIAAVVVYAHTYLYVPADTAGVRLGLAYHNEYQAWLNGAPIGASTSPALVRNETILPITLAKGWNRLLLKIANQAEVPLGFYASLTIAGNRRVPGLVCSVDGGNGPLEVATRSMNDVGPASLPTAYREWPYVGADSTPYLTRSDIPNWQNQAQGWHEGYVVKAPGLTLQARGGQPPYRWTVSAGALPDGLRLEPDGLLVGTIAEQCPLRSFDVTMTVTDAAGANATRAMAISVHERPNKWVERCGLIGLAHAPQLMNAQQIQDMAVLMKRQGYGLVMPIGYGNGTADHVPRWPSSFLKDNPLAGVLTAYRTAVLGQGMKFGVYLGEMELPQSNNQAGCLTLCDELMRETQPSVIWIDHAGRNFPLSDAVYSMWRAYDNDVVVIKNGAPTKGSFDWDMLCFEGWGAWGRDLFGIWPGAVPWFKQHRPESWRFIPDKKFPIGWGPDPTTFTSTWQDYVPVFLSLIGEGYVANLDHTGTWEASPTTSHMYRVHEGIAAWANPAGCPPLTEAYIDVVPGPLDHGRWGYQVIDAARTTLYAYVLKNDLGRDGVLPAGKQLGTKTLTLATCRVPVSAVTLMNRHRPLAFVQQGEQIVITIPDELIDPVATILKIALAAPHPPGVGGDALGQDADGRVNLAFRKPVKMLSLDGQTELGPSGLNFADGGVDGKISTYAMASLHWAWLYHVDLLAAHEIASLQVVFPADRFPTEYKILVSSDGATWRQVAYANNGRGDAVTVNAPGQGRYVRIVGLKPDGENQVGSQMGISEVRVYGKE